MLSRSQFFVKEHVGIFKLADAYDILDPETNAIIGLAQEKPHPLVVVLSFLINKQFLPTRVEIIQNPNERGEGVVVVEIKRGIALLRSKVEVLIKGQSAGYFKSKLFSFGGGFWVYDNQDNKVAEVRGDWKGWNFKLLDSKEKELGTVTKKWAGIGKELFTSADNYIISLSPNAASNQNTTGLLLAAGLAIDTIFKEK
jgi:uncharacterized protein YxjI